VDDPFKRQFQSIGRNLAGRTWVPRYGRRPRRSHGGRGFPRPGVSKMTRNHTVLKSMGHRSER
jgi:hypothetical protein